MKTWVCLACVIAGAGSAQAANLFVNPSFELGAFVPNGDNTMVLSPGSTAITGWTARNSDVAWISVPNPFGLVPADGSMFLDLTGYPGDFGGISQDVSTIPDGVYRLTFSQGSGQSGDSSLRVIASDVQGTVQSSDFTDPGLSPPRWISHSLLFIARENTTTITFGHYFGSGNYTGLDNVDLEFVRINCRPDVNQDGNADQGDVDYLINVVAGGPNDTGIDPDFNQDGNVDQGDIDSLINVIAGGDCP